MTRSSETAWIRAHINACGKTDPPVFEVDGNPPPPGARLRRVATVDDASLRAAFWSEPGARGSLLVFPGRTEFLEIYFETVWEARAMGLAAGAVDWRYQGLNARFLSDMRKGHVLHFSDYQMDAQAFWQAAYEEGMPRPWLLLSHSMGGAIAYLHASLSTHPPDGLILLAPMFGLKLGGMNSSMAEAVSRLAVRIGLGERYVPGVDGRTVMERGFAKNPLTSDEEKFNLVLELQSGEPDLALGGPSWRWMREALCATRHIRHQAPLRMPIVALLADRDRVVDNRKTAALLRDNENATIQTLTNCLHCPLLERNEIRRQVFGAIQEFTDRMTGAAANR